ncbi:MAG: hypothetical protein ACR2JB_08295 [Bryobacteraceae bacterium]
MAVIFADGTAEGDDRRIAAIFATRSRYAKSLKSEREALAASPDADSALAKLHALQATEGLEKEIIQGTEAELRRHREQGGAYQDFRDGMVSELERTLPAAERQTRRAQ